MLTYRMMKGPHEGQTTTDVEQYLRWLSAIAIVTPELAQRERDYAGEQAKTDRVIDAAAAKFEDRETE